MVPVSGVGPVLCGFSGHCMHCRATRLHQPERLWLWADGQEEPACADALLSALWTDSGPGPKRGTEYCAGSPPYPEAQENGHVLNVGNAWGQMCLWRGGVSHIAKHAG